MNHLTHSRITARSFVVLFGVSFFAMAESSRAVVPAPAGGYPGVDTAEGQNALFTSLPPWGTQP